MNTPSKPEIEQESALHLLPLALAFASGLIQLGSCGTRFVKVGVPVGLAISLAAILSAHLVLRRLRLARRERLLAWLALFAAYLSLLIIPIAGYGILILAGGFGR
jgi:hypothetical protein